MLQQSFLAKAKNPYDKPPPRERIKRISASKHWQKSTKKKKMASTCKRRAIGKGRSDLYHQEWLKKGKPALNTIKKSFISGFGKEPKSKGTMPCSKRHDRENNPRGRGKNTRARLAVRVQKEKRSPNPSAKERSEVATTASFIRSTAGYVPILGKKTQRLIPRDRAGGHPEKKTALSCLAQQRGGNASIRRLEKCFVVPHRAGEKILHANHRKRRNGPKKPPKFKKLSR